MPRVICRQWMMGLLSVFFFWPLCARAGESVGINVSDAARVSGETIFLKDIASICAPEGLKEKIGDIQLGRSPRPGKEKKISGRQLRSMVKAAQALPADVPVAVPESIRIERAFQAVKETVLAEACDRFLSENLKGEEFKIRRFKVRGANAFPVGELSLQIAPCGKQSLVGAVGLRVTVLVDGKKSGRLTLMAWVDRFEKVVCAARSVAGKAMITEADLTMTTVNTAENPAGIIRNIGEAAGQVAKFGIRPGTPIRAAMLEVPPLVRKGQRVTILASSGPLRVSSLGIAKSSGGMGEQVRVENSSSNKTIVARVTGDATVEVTF